MKKVIVLISFAMGLFYVGCKSDHKKEEVESTKYLATSPVLIDTTYAKDFVAQIKSVRNIEIRALEKGYLDQIFVDEGQSVKKGQLLFRIMPKMYEAEWKKSMAEVHVVEIELSNTQNLLDKNIVSKNELAMVKAKLEQAQANADIAKLHLSFTEVRAAFDGTINRIPLKLGSYVEEGELLTSLSDNAQMFAYFNVSEPEYLDYQMHIANRGNKEVQLILANNDLFGTNGKVETIEGEFENETGNIAFRARFSNPNQMLRHGETGKVRMNYPMKGALIIPQKATFEIQDKKYVYLIDAKGRLKASPIKILTTMPDLYVIADGLQSTDKILFEGLQKADEGDQINYEFIAPKVAISNLKLAAE